MNKNEIWKYYGEVAKKFGETPQKDKDDKIVTDEEGNVVFRRENYSLQFFYECTLEDMVFQAPLFNAFLGEENAIDAGQWDCEIPSKDEISQWLSINKAPYPSQIEAICNAVSKPLTLIQGPPGTGKTEMILNLLSVIHGKYPDKTVAVVSANNEAINNITDKIEKDEAFSNIKEAYAQWGSNGILYQWQKDHAEYEEYFYQKQRGKSTPICRFDPQLLTKIPLFSCTIHSLRKIFVDEELFSQDIFQGNEQFDYVIVDECSQVSTLLGIVAMGSAKEHLVLIGDNEQLSPVIDEKKLEEIEKRYSMQDVPKVYRMIEDNSFLRVCGKVFEGRARNVMLSEHYRCHPAIIGFCNKHVYDGELVVRTVDDGQFPIRVLWYEGEYSEYINKKNKEDARNKRSLRNMRQIEIFLREEWPLLCNRIENNPATSICVISPYRGQLEILEKLLKSEIESERNHEIKALLGADLGIEGGKEEPEEKIPCLTIHKSQGKGFDIVCFLSVCDYDSPSHEPWAQQRRMINVAVSRAKKEFHVITCNQWLPEEFQENEIGYVRPHPKQADDYYLLKLIDYTYKNLKNKNLQNGDFGFHRSAITSLLDRIPIYRENETKISFAQKKHVQAASAPEKCMRDFLVKHFSGEYKIYKEILLGEIYPSGECDDCELKEYIENGSRIDFLICKDKNVLLAIEVDGEHHRSGDEKEERHDELKDRCFELLEKEMAYLRINTDGSGCWKGTCDKSGIKVLSKEKEIQKMCDYLEKAEELSEHREFANENGDTPECAEADKGDLLDFYKEFLNDCLGRFREYMYNPDGSLRNDLPALDYQRNNYEEIDHGRRETDDYYFCKYGIAYAFEYAMLYEIMLRIHSTDQFGVCSFGCGGFIDAWALAYARAGLREQGVHADLKLYYQGIDIVRWPTAVFGELVEEVDDNSPLRGISIFYNDTMRDISDFTFRKPQWNGIEGFNPGIGGNPRNMYYNVLMFSKILNVVSPEDLNVFIERLKGFEYEQGKKQRDYYICVSHSPSEERLRRGDAAVRRIVDMFEEKGFIFSADLQEILSEEHYNDICDSYGIERKDGFAFPVYNVNGRISELNSDFTCDNIRSFFKKMYEDSDERYKCRQMTNANIAFQIIKLTKSER